MVLNKIEFTSLCEQKAAFKNPYLQSLAHIYNDSWNKAHDLIQDYNDPLASRIHGFLHRIEGDDWNARYWYSRAGISFKDIPFKNEWDEIVDDYFENL